MIPFATERADSSVVGTVYLVGLAVVLAAIASAFVLSNGAPVTTDAPTITLSHDVVDDGDDGVVAVTHEGGDTVEVRKMYVSGSVEIDIGSAPGTTGAADSSSASSREAFAEAPPGDPPQVDIGETWESGETIYLDPVTDPDGITISIFWNTKEVRGVNPGTVEGSESYKIAEFTVRE